MRGEGNCYVGEKWRIYNMGTRDGLQMRCGCEESRLWEYMPNMHGFAARCVILRIYNGGNK